jgi:hypothetical protein
MNPKITPDIPELTWQQEKYLRQKQKRAHDLGVWYGAAMGLLALALEVGAREHDEVGGWIIATFCFINIFVLHGKLKKEGLTSDS